MNDFVLFRNLNGLATYQKPCTIGYRYHIDLRIVYKSFLVYGKVCYFVQMYGKKMPSLTRVRVTSFSPFI